MNEANNNAFSINSESTTESIPTNHNKIEDIQRTGESGLDNNHLSSDSIFLAPEEFQAKNADKEILPESSETKMNWQKVAHKLREYNRKLLKKVFRLEQDLAEVENKFDKQTEKSRSSDLLVAKQAEEIKAFQENIANFERQSQQKLANLNKLNEQQQTEIDKLSQNYDLSQKQIAQIERDCIALQEEYSSKVYELNIKEKEVKDLKAKLSQQQRYAMQYKAELERSKEQIKIAKPIDKQQTGQNKLNKLSIKPWSVTTTSETNIPLPHNKFSATSRREISKNPNTAKTAAEIATWTASEVSSPETNKPKEKVKSSASKKPQSLAAVELPTFPRPK